MVTKCLLYARFSPRPKAQVDETNTIERQIELCHDYADKHGYEVMGAYEDREKSRNDINRPGLITAIDRLRNGWILISSDSSRFGAGTTALMFESDILAKKATIEFADGQAMIDTPEQKMARHILYVVDEYKRETIGIKTAVRMRKMQKDGRCVGGHAPYGWIRSHTNTEMIVKEPTEWKAVLKMAKLHNSGKNLSQIARQMEADGAPRRGDRWFHTTVRRVLMREGFYKKDSENTTIIQPMAV